MGAGAVWRHSRADQAQRGLLRVGDQAVEIHRHQVGAAEIAQLARFFAAGGNLGHGDVFEHGLERVEQVEIFFAFGALVGADHHFLGAAAARDQPHSGFDQAHVGFGGGVDARAVQRDLAAAAQRQALRRDHHGLRRMLDGERGVLELPHHEVQVVPFLLLRGHQDEHQVRAGGKIHGLVGDHHGVELGAQAREAFVDHGEQVAADGVHLGVEFAADHAVAQVDQARAGILLDFLRAVLERFQNQDAFGLRRGLVDYCPRDRNTTSRPARTDKTISSPKKAAP